MSVIATETFTASDGTLITARTCDTGQSWTKTTDSDAANLVINSNRAGLSTPSTTAFTRYVLGVGLGSADYTISGVLTPLVSTSAIHAGLYLRASAAAATGYLIRRSAGTYEWHIERNVGGTETTLVTTSGLPANVLNPINVTFSVTGVGATVSLSATIAIPAFSVSQTITFNDTDASRIVATGLPGVGLADFNAATNYTWDTLEVDGMPSGAILKGFYYAQSQGLI